MPTMSSREMQFIYRCPSSRANALTIIDRKFMKEIGKMDQFSEAIPCIFCEEKIPEAYDECRVLITCCPKHRDLMVRKGLGGLLLCKKCKHYLCSNVNCDCECHRLDMLS